MKRFFFLFAVCALIFSPTVAMAAVVGAGESYVLAPTDPINEDVYGAGGTVSVSARINGDIAVAGGTVSISGDVRDDILAAGGTLTIAGTVGDDVRVAGGTTVVTGIIKGDLVAVGGQVHITRDATISGSVLAGGGSVTIDGHVLGGLRMTGGSLVINGIIDGPVFAKSDRFTVGAGAVLGQRIEYRGPRPAEVDPSARLAQDVIYTRSAAALPDERTVMALVGALFGALIALKVLMVLVATYALVYAFPRLTHDVLHATFAHVGWSILRGIGAIILIPLGAIVCAVILVGLPISFIIVLVYALFWALTVLLAPVAWGSVAMHLVRKEPLGAVAWYTIPVGLLVVGVIGFVPVLGGLAQLAMRCAVFGGIAIVWYRAMWLKRAIAL
ncbi:MAG: hypothetical protein AAB463_01970 [Patescibacteria group bacterium]